MYCPLRYESKHDMPSFCGNALLLWFLLLINRMCVCNCLGGKGIVSFAKFSFHSFLFRYYVTICYCEIENLVMALFFV